MRLCEKTIFKTDKGNYCYDVMPFGLKSAGVVYQRLMDRIFADQMGRCLDVYVDDMVVRFDVPTDHLKDLEDVFHQVRHYNMRLNPAKCTFGVVAGKFLGFMLTSRGIEVNFDKCTTVLAMRSPANLKEIQRLVGRLASLSRFIPKLAERIRPIVKRMKKGAKTESWDADCERVFAEVKTILTNPSVMNGPHPKGDLQVYMGVSAKTISAAFQEQPEPRLIYFVSRVLQAAETRYQLVEKVAFALLNATRRLRPYFQSH